MLQQQLPLYVTLFENLTTEMIPAKSPIPDPPPPPKNKK